MVASPKDDERAVGEVFLGQHGEHGAERVIEPAHIRVVAGEFAPDVGQVFEKAGHARDFLHRHAAAGLLAAREIVRAPHADERAVRVVAIHVVEKRAALLARGPEKLARGGREFHRVTRDLVVRFLGMEFLRRLVVRRLPKRRDEIPRVVQLLLKRPHLGLQRKETH